MRSQTAFISAAAFLGLSACHHFEGTLGRIGFVSNLQTTASSAWTPGSPIAAGSFAEVKAAADLRDPEREEPLDVDGFAGSGLIAAMPGPEAHVAFTGPDGASGTVRFWGEVDDHFAVRFADADRASLHHPLDATFGLDTEPEVAVAAGEAVALDVRLRAASGEVLGWDVDTLAVIGQGGVSAWAEGGLVHLVADGDGAVFVSVTDVGTFSIPIEAADPEDLSSVDVLTVEGGAMAVAWLDDDTRLFGAPFTWEGSEHAGEVVETTGAPAALLGFRRWTP